MMSNSTNRQHLLLVILALLVITYLPLRAVQENDFVNYDDYRYVLENKMVRDGMTFEGVSWAFSNLEAGFWHPLTWLSHMLDVELYGVNAAGHHLTSLLLHFANCFLLFLFLERTTKSLWRSGLAAALFAIHPLHVESVAWVSQRKDLLSTLFWNLALLAYAGHAVNPSKKGLGIALLFFSLGLMAKPMVVTLPLILLLLDYWPLGRMEGKEVSSLKPLFLEKVPFLALSVISVAITYHAEETIGALPGLGSYPVHVRVYNAVVSCLTYAVKMIFPSGLSAIYLHPGSYPFWKIAAGVVFILSISYFACRQYRARPYLLVGWLWYLITLLSVIGLVQIGSHAYADRYTYVPLTGLFLMIVWGLPAVSSLTGKGRLSLGVLITAVLVGLGWGSARQVGYWKDSTTLFERAVRVEPRNYLALKNLGFTLAQRGRFEEAAEHFQKAIQLNPTYLEGIFHLANTLEVLGRKEAAISCYMRIIDLNPSLAKPHSRVGRILLQEGRREEALVHLSAAVRFDPLDSETRHLIESLLTKAE
jgi:tetratricopeptide (TPR) repeat protein